MKFNYKENYKKFKDWQTTPFEVAPMSNDDQVCSTCGTEYMGNFCPRCGQSAKIEPRMSVWKTLLLVLDVWGLGNRGMFRTLRDLILRPGYLICDYLQGKRSAYFPPFKLLFLLTTLSILVGHGFNIFHINYQQELQPFIFTDSEYSTGKEATIFEGIASCVNFIANFQRDYPALFQLFYMCIGGYFYYLFFKNSKIIGKLTFSEFFIALVYMYNMYAIYNTFITFFCYFGLEEIYWSWIPIFYLIPLKQMTGYSIRATIGRAFAGLFIGLISIVVFIILLTSVITLIYNQL